MAYGSSAQASLEAVQAAIDKCLEASRYRTGNHEKQMAELKVLREMEKELKAEVARENGTSFSVITLEQRS